MPYGCDPILTSFTSITTSSSDCPGEGTKRTHQGLWRLSDVEGRANIALRVARSVARRPVWEFLSVTAGDGLPRANGKGHANIHVRWHWGEGEMMTLLTSAECRQIADRKMVEAEGDPLHGKEFRATAEAWLFLAEKIEQAEAIEALKAKGK